MKLLVLFLTLSAMVHSSLFSLMAWKPESLVLRQAQQHKRDEKARIKAFIYDFWDHYMYPLNQIEALKINSSYFTTDCIGRVSPTRDFVGQELNTEYVFGLFSQLTDVQIRLVGTPMDYKIVNFINDGPKVATSVVANYVVPLINLTIPMQVDMWYQLEYNVEHDNYSIARYDSIFRNYDRVYELGFDYALKFIEENFPQFNVSGHSIFKVLIISSICKIHQDSCLGKNQQYKDFDSCVEFLSHKRLGKGHEGGRDTLFCRGIHQVMLPFRPSVHCSHIGPTGGEMCRDDDTEYNMIPLSYDRVFGNSFNTLHDDETDLGENEAMVISQMVKSGRFAGFKL